MRQFALVVFDLEDKIVDRFDFQYVTDINVGGIKLELSTIETDVEDIITKVTQSKSKITFTVNNTTGYAGSTVLGKWIQKYSKAEYSMALEYRYNTLVRYCEGKVTELAKSELTEYKALNRKLTFTMTTPFFARIENKIQIQVAAIGKSYTFQYPYSYGANIISNNDIDNTYITDVPLIVKIYGSITHPDIQLLDEDSESYNRVQFADLTMESGDYLIINSAQKKIYFYDSSAGTLTDYAPYVNPSYDTFLRAQSGNSTISINLESSDTGYLIGSWRQYDIDS